MKKLKKVTFSEANDTLPGNLTDAGNNVEETEEINEYSTIDGNIISRIALKTALETGKGLMVGGFFVGATLNADLMGVYANVLK